MKNKRPSQMSETELAAAAGSFVSEYEKLSGEEKESIRQHCCGQCAFCREPKLDRAFTA